MNQPLFRKAVLERQRTKLWGEVVLAQPLSTRVFTLVIGGLLACIIAYLVLGSYTRKETVQGYLVPSEGLVQVYAPQSGTVVESLAESGDMVDKGDVLARVETGKNLEDGFALSTLLLNVLEQQKDQLKRRIERHRARQEARQEFLETSIEGRKRQAAQLERQRAVQEERLDLAEKRYLALEALRDDKLISEEDYQSRYQSFLDEDQEYERLRQSIVAEQANLEEAEFELDSLASETDETVDELESEIAGIEQQTLQQRGDRAFSIRAPTEGQVTSVQVSEGQTVAPQRPLLALLPDKGELKAELFVPTRAIGFIESDLPVNIRYDAFPYERFGIHDSEVENVAKTILAPDEVDAPMRFEQPVYRVTAELTGQALEAFGREMPLQAGMTLEADIQLEQRPLYQWILRPLYSLKGTL